MRMRCIATSHPHYYYRLEPLGIFAFSSFLCYNILCTPYTFVVEKGQVMTTASNAIQLILVEEIGSSPNDWAWKFYFPSSADSSKTFSIDFDCSTPWELFIDSLEPAFMTVGDVGHFRDMCYSVCDSIYMELVFPNGAAPLIEHDVLYQLLEVARRFEYITCTNLYFNVSADSFYQPREIEVIA